jgi:hypothetical protein
MFRELRKARLVPGLEGATAPRRIMVRGFRVRASQAWADWTYNPAAWAR